MIASFGVCHTCLVEPFPTFHGWVHGNCKGITPTQSSFEVLFDQKSDTDAKESAGSSLQETTWPQGEKKEWSRRDQRTKSLRDSRQDDFDVEQEEIMEGITTISNPDSVTMYSSSPDKRGKAIISSCLLSLSCQMKSLRMTRQVYPLLSKTLGMSLSWMKRRATLTTRVGLLHFSRVVLSLTSRRTKTFLRTSSLLFV
jgi:hypothetical protein